MTYEKRVLLTAILTACSSSAAQTTVPFASAGWKDFGTTNITGLTGNFLPGWTSLTASPDLGNNLFFIPTTSLSGAADDAAMWMLGYDLASIGGVSNESVRLSLDGFSIGQTYQIDFSASIVREPFAGWNGNDYSLDVALTGADISTFNTSILNDPIDSDGMNVWDAQSLVFVATSTAITFDFGGNPTVDPTGLATRYGFDGIDVRVVPAPGTLGALAVGGLACTRRRRA